MQNTIKDYRKKAGLTQQQLADFVGCRRETIANLESGKYEPSFSMLDAIANTLRVTLYELAPSCQSARFYKYAIQDAELRGKERAIESIMNS